MANTARFASRIIRSEQQPITAEAFEFLQFAAHMVATGGELHPYLPTNGAEPLAIRSAPHLIEAS